MDRRAKSTHHVSLVLLRRVSAARITPLLLAASIACSGAGETIDEGSNADASPREADVASPDGAAWDAGATVDASPDGAPDAGPTCAVGTCVDGDACGVDGDCKSGACSTLTKRCVTAPSCRGVLGASGVETCGPDGPGAAVESCCRSLPLPTRTTRRLDRYEITTGRVRAFLTALGATNGGVPNVRAFAKAHAQANPTSQLGTVLASYPGLLDVLPDQASPAAPLPLPVHLGVFPLDPMNALDGCYMGSGGYGHATYWQPSSDLAGYGLAARRYARETLDQKPMNCVMPMMLAAFCAWDGGELARTADFREVWGRNPAAVGAATVFVPWSAVLAVGAFNWRNGHGAACSPAAWPGCMNPQPYHHVFPELQADGQPFAPAEDDSPAIGAPGRFADDVTKAKSASGEGWLDVGGNLMEAAWPVGAVNAGANAIVDVCDVSAAAGAGETACARRGRAGVRRYAGALPHVALVGYSFEGHARRSEAYLASQDGAESRLVPGDLKPITFQYGKVGGRCARPGP